MSEEAQQNGFSKPKNTKSTRATVAPTMELTEITQKKGTTSRPSSGVSSKHDIKFENNLETPIENAAVIEIDQEEETQKMDLNDLIKHYEQNESDNTVVSISTTTTSVVMPNIFDQDVQHDQLIQLRSQIELPITNEYVKHFDDHVVDDTIMVGAIAIDDIQIEEQELRKEHLKYKEQEEEKKRLFIENLKITEEEVKQRLARDYLEKRKELQTLKLILEQRHKFLQEELHKAFRKSETQLITKLEERKGEVKTYYGDLETVMGFYDGAQHRRWKVDWDNSPQPVEIRVKLLRGMRDKLPRGKYAIRVSQYSRLGGHILRWSNMRGQFWGGCTLPVEHPGHFYSTEIKVNQSVFTVLPSRPSIKPGMVICFEIYMLKSVERLQDLVVAWGCFPICDSHFDVVSGKYKIPMLRGPMDNASTKFEHVDWLISHDLDNWMCNLYFEVVRLPRYQAGQSEYEVELQFSAQLLDFPERDDLYSDEVLELLIHEKKRSWADFTTIRSKKAKNVVEAVKLTYDEDAKEEETGSSVALSKSRSQGSTGGHSYYGSRLLHLNYINDVEPAQLDYKFGQEEESGFVGLVGEPGIYYKHYKRTPRDDYMDFVNTLEIATPFTKRSPSSKSWKRSGVGQLDQYTYAIQQNYDDKGKMSKEGSRRLEYVRRMLLSEVGFSQWRSSEFWTMIFMFILCFFVRLYLHYCGQYIFLIASYLPVSTFNFYAYTVQLNYQATLLSMSQEVVVVLLGPMTNVIVFLLFMLISLIAQVSSGVFPDLCSKFILAFGIMTLLDPLLILIVDCAMQRYLDMGNSNPYADAAKLYYYFVRMEGSGIGGIILTLLIYLALFILTLAFLYIYFLRLHNQGRMLDCYWRLHGTEEQLFLPYDLEVSHQELAYLVRKAEAWRGEEGARRKITVTDYVWEDENESDDFATIRKPDVTTHVAIHTLHLDGLRQLYRHFLKLPDGAIIEVYGNFLELPQLKEDVKQGDKVPEKLQDDFTDLKFVTGASEKKESLKQPATINVVKKRRTKTDSSKA